MAEKNKNLTVYGIFSDQLQVEGAIDRLRTSGFRASDISVLFGDESNPKAFGYEKDTKAPEGAITGAGLGGVLGGVLGWLAGIGSIAIPGVGPFIAAGPIMAALGGLGVGAMAGSLTGALVGIGIPEYEAKRYEGLVRTGKALLSVHCDDRSWAKQAEEILEAAGGKDISSAGEAKAEIPVDEHGYPEKKAV
jgi:hypothetical protein